MFHCIIDEKLLYKSLVLLATNLLLLMPDRMLSGPADTASLIKFISVSKVVVCLFLFRVCKYDDAKIKKGAS